MRTILNPDAETFIIGGLGSDRTCMQNVVDGLSGHVQGLQGVTYSEACKMREKLWEQTDQQNLIAYSGSGPLAAKAIQLYQFRPSTMTFISPPNELSRWSVMVGFARAARARTEERTESDNHASTFQMVRRFLAETGTHPPEYLKLIHHSRRFNQLASLVALQSMGISQVSMIVPRNDEMFSSYELPLDGDQSGVDGARYVVIEGGHSRFSNDPLGVLRESEHAPFAIVNPETLGIDVPKRLSMPPTFAESLSIAGHSLQNVTKRRLLHTA